MESLPTAALFLIDGCEETEAVTTLDILRRGEVSVTSISLTGTTTVHGKHGIDITADTVFENVEHTPFAMLIVPGGTIAYLEHQGLIEAIVRQNDAGRRLAAICAAPSVLGRAGVLRGRRAVCYPGMEGYLTGAVIGTTNVETDGNITTSRGPGTTVAFALALLELLRGPQTAQKVKEVFLAL